MFSTNLLIIKFFFRKPKDYYVSNVKTSRCNFCEENGTNSDVFLTFLDIALIRNGTEKLGVTDFTMREQMSATSKLKELQSYS